MKRMETETWQSEQTKQAIAEADSGEFATALDLQKVLSKYDDRTVKLQSSSVASRPINSATACLALKVPSSTFTTHCVIGISTPSDSARWLTVRAQ